MSRKKLSQAYTSKPLTNYSTGIFNNAEDFIATKILPIFPVQEVAGDVYGYGNEALRIVDTARGVYGSYNKVNLRVQKTGLYKLEDFGLFGELFEEDYRDAEQPIDPELDTTEYITQKLMLDMEAKTADVLQDPAIITQNVALSGADRWDQYSTSDPLADIELARTTVFDAIGKAPNTIILSWKVLFTLKNHPMIRQFFPGAAKITSDMVVQAMGELLGFEKVLVGKVKQNENNLDSATQTLSNVWDDVAIVAYIETTPRKKSTTLGWTFANQASWRVRKLGQNDIGKESVTSNLAGIIGVNMYYDQVIVDTRCAYLIYDVLT